MQRGVVLAMVASLTLIAGCDECAGTPSCRSTPEISYVGQFIERHTGDGVQDVLVTFVRQSGIELLGDTVRARTDGDGYFQLRAPALEDGTMRGHLVITPPAPFPAFTIPDLDLRTNTTRGAGHNLGRMVVNPYLLLIGHVRDRKTHVPLPDATVTMRRISGGRAERDTMTFTTDFGGQFSWEPTLLDPSPILAEFEIDAPGYPRTYRVPRTLVTRYRDSEMTFVILPVGSGLAYAGASVRRGSGEHVPDVMVEFVRISGIGIQPPQLLLPLDVNAAFYLPIEPLTDGALIGEIRILPPPRFPPETTRVEMHTSDDDVVQFLGTFRFGAQVHAVAQLRDDQTFEPIPAGTVVVMKRTSGMPLDWPFPAPDGDFRLIQAGGTLDYHAPTPDSGQVVFDMIVRLPEPFAWDTVRNLTTPAWYSDSAFDIGTVLVRRRPKQ